MICDVPEGDGDVVDDVNVGPSQHVDIGRTESNVDETPSRNSIAVDRRAFRAGSGSKAVAWVDMTLTRATRFIVRKTVGTQHRQPRSTGMRPPPIRADPQRRQSFDAAANRVPMSAPSQRSAPSQPSWKAVDTAPFGVALRIIVAGGPRKHFVLPYPCRRTAAGWTSAVTGEPLALRPTHWQLYEGATPGQHAPERRA
jgi:hypothetical protein